MDLVVLHYHLGHGGVTKVVANHLTALAQTRPDHRRIRVLILHGGRDDGWPGNFATGPRTSIQLHSIPGIGYHTSRAPSPKALANQIHEAMSSHGFHPEACLLHVHNHSLGKNPALPLALQALAHRGVRQLLQIHDFAEDMRPGNYVQLKSALQLATASQLGHALYPQAGHLHYAVLNARDLDILKRTGFKNVHLLPNPVFALPGLTPRPQARRKLAETIGVSEHRPLLLYPVRAIRRKNIGEALLWSALAEEAASFGLSLPTLNPVEQIQYQNWKRLASELRLPVYFELGTHRELTFQDNLGAAERVLTTSLAEGFGMVFLEGWLAGRMLVGRDLPEITSDFKQAGVQLDHLSPEVYVPVELVDRNDLWQRLVHAYQDVRQAYGMGDAGDPAEQAGLEAKISDHVDFGDLDEAMQEELIRRAVEDPRVRAKIADANPWLAGCWDPARDAEEPRIQQNADATLQAFGPREIGRRLWRIYEEILNSNPTNLEETVDADQMLQLFLDPRRFRLLRT